MRKKIKEAMMDLYQIATSSLIILVMILPCHFAWGVWLQARKLSAISQSIDNIQKSQQESFRRSLERDSDLLLKLEQLAWLQRQWTTAERLRPRAVQERPTAWAAYERSLVRAERLCVAGSGGREDLRQAKVEVEALEQALSEPLVGIDLLLEEKNESN